MLTAWHLQGHGTIRRGSCLGSSSQELSLWEEGWLTIRRVQLLRLVEDPEQTNEEICVEILEDSLVLTDEFWGGSWSDNPNKDRVRLYVPPASWRSRLQAADLREARDHGPHLVP